MSPVSSRMVVPQDRADPGDALQPHEQVGPGEVTRDPPLQPGDLILQGQPELELHQHAIARGRIGKERFELGASDLLEGIAREHAAGGAADAGLDRKHQSHRLPNQGKAAAQQVARGALLARVDVAFRQQAKPHQLRQVQRIGVVVTVLEARVLRDRRGVDQMDAVTPSIRPSTSQYQL